MSSVILSVWSVSAWVMRSYWLRSTVLGLSLLPRSAVTAVMAIDFLGPVWRQKIKTGLQWRHSYDSNQSNLCGVCTNQFYCIWSVEDMIWTKWTHRCLTGWTQIGSCYFGWKCCRSGEWFFWSWSLAASTRGRSHSEILLRSQCQATWILCGGCIRTRIV